MIRSAGTNVHLPVILIRGFGGLGIAEEKRLTHQGFETGTVYPSKRGENYIYEGMLLSFLKAGWRYQDATNVVGYYGTDSHHNARIPESLQGLDALFFDRGRVVLDASMADRFLDSDIDVYRSVWVFRYYDLDDRAFKTYGEALVRLITLIRELCQVKKGILPQVNIVAHSMGGLIVREAIQRAYPGANLKAADFINKVVTLGTPHKGISFQILQDWLIPDVRAADELKHFSPEFQDDEAQQVSFKNFPDYFPPERLLSVVGTSYRTYEIKPSSWLNRVFSVGGEFGLNYNRSDGLVKQAFAQLPGSPRTFVHKCHGGPDSLMSARESFEIATRFFFGNVKVRLKLMKALVTRGRDWIGDSEFFLGVGIKPRGVDFDLFHQSAEAENCYGPFKKVDLSDSPIAFDWAGPERLIWEGWLDTHKIMMAKSGDRSLVFRFDIYVGERDLLGIGFSDNVVFRKQYYMRAALQHPLVLYLYPDESFAKSEPEEYGTVMVQSGNGWQFNVTGTGFEGTFGVEIDLLGGAEKVNDHDMIRVSPASSQESKEEGGSK